MSKKRQKKKDLRTAARKLAKMPRMTVEYLTATYTRTELMRIFKYQMINKVQVLTKTDVSMVLGLDPKDPLIYRDREGIAPQPSIDPSLQVKL